MKTDVVYGVRAVLEVLRAGRRKVKSIFYVKESARRFEEIFDLAAKKNIPLKTAGRRQLDERTAGGNHQSVFAVVEPPAVHGDIQSFIASVTAGGGKTVIAVLDSIQDPGNFGAILRSAETFGVRGAIFAKNRSCGINSTVVKTSAGATEYLEFCRVANIARTLEELRTAGFHIIAAEPDGDTPLDKLAPSFPLAVVMGSEEKGVRPLVKKSCDETVRIPAFGRVESLNVSTAAAVVFYEISVSNRSS